MQTVWMNLALDGSSPGLFGLAPEIASRLGPSCRVIVTSDDPMHVASDAEDADIEVLRGACTTPGAATKLITRERPSLAVFAGRNPMAAAAQACRDGGVPTILIGPAIPGNRLFFSRIADRRMRRQLGCFDLIVSQDVATTIALERIGVPAHQVAQAGPLQQIPSPPEHDEDELDALAGLTATRPIWAAVGIVREEWEALHHAHRLALRASHRLLLIAEPSDPSEGPEMRAFLEGRGWSTAIRSEDEDPGADIQVLVADCPGETGLWYRMAPITFLGSSLVQGGTGRDPMGPAALGSAILHGPHMSRYRAEVAQLRERQCAVEVARPEALGHEVTALLSPDRAARLARGAWELVSEGADANDRAVEAIVAMATVEGS